MITETKAANAMGGKTARACDGCLRKRARWYCVADDAFLCQGCDSSIHSANQLASRHERVRLESASSKARTCGSLSNIKDGGVPLWHQGFTRKARTPRPNKAMSTTLVQRAKDLEEKQLLNSNDTLVPELGSEEGSILDDENTDQENLLCQVPVFDPFEAEINCGLLGREGTENQMGNKEENMVAVTDHCFGQEGTCDLDDLHGFLSSDIDLAEFAADVESLLGGNSGFDDDSCDINGLDLLECKEENGTNICLGDTIVKVKDEEDHQAEGVNGTNFQYLDTAYSLTREEVDWNFDYDQSPVMGKDDEDEKVVPLVETAMANTIEGKAEISNMSLRLNYEAVIDAWASQGCPWTTGSRPESIPDDWWPDCTGEYPKHVHHPYGGVGCHWGCRDGGREARVSRYREKRRTRLFSKKIRYEVRKLNAEKRPRMKGRFVKRTSFAGSTAAFPYLNQS